MVETSTLLSLPQLVDLSLNCQEGLVHFHALHSLLRIFIQQSGLEDVTVEFRGKDGERIRGLIDNTKPSPGTHFTEYSINGGSKKRRGSKKAVSLQNVKEQHKIDKNEKLDKIETAKERELRVIERRKNSKEDPELNPPPLKSPPPSMYEDPFQTMVLVDTDLSLPQLSIAVTKDVFVNLQSEMEQLKDEMKELKELPGNMGLIEATKDKNTPIQDMFQLLTLNKRLDATEVGVNKLGSILEDVVKTGAQNPDAIIKELGEVRNSLGDINDNKPPKIPSSVLGDLKELEQRVDELEKQVRNLISGQYVPEDKPGEDNDNEKPDQDTEKTKDDDRRKTDDDNKNNKNKDNEPSKLPERNPSVIEGLDLGEMPTNEALSLLQKELANLTIWIEESFRELNNKKSSDSKEVNLDCLDEKLSEYTKQLQEFDNVYNNQITIINQQLMSLQKDMDNIVIKLDLVMPGGDSTGLNAETMMELANKLLLLEKEILSVSEHASRLQAEKVELGKHIDNILEQIDILKIVKANREDLEDALGDKADACAINRKVSHDQFDAACDDLSRGIEEALKKLEEQQEMWHQALDSIQEDMGRKLDKNEVDPLRDFVNNKLKILHDKLKALAAFKREQEAAGTKSKLLRDVNCISCDKEVVMKKEMDPTLKPKPYAMPPPKNMAPYLAYELDQLRKQQKCIPGSKNLNFLESALKSKKDKEHICNRYCGGSHTVTTPQQRVARLGHFLEQWGPDIAPMHDEYIRGKDGQMYKARDDSAIRKPSKSEAPAAEQTAAKSGDAAAKDDKAQSERTTYISPSAEQLITQDKVEKQKQDGEKKHSIGSAPIMPKHSLSQEKALKAASSKSFQGSVDNESQPTVGAFRPSKAENKKIGFQE